MISDKTDFWRRPAGASVSTVAIKIYYSCLLNSRAKIAFFGVVSLVSTQVVLFAKKIDYRMLFNNTPHTHAESVSFAKSILHGSDNIIFDYLIYDRFTSRPILPLIMRIDNTMNWLVQCYSMFTLFAFPVLGIS
jgi:hypothetical protein